MRFVSAIAVTILIVGGLATASAADEHPAPKKTHHVKRPPPPAEATEPEKKDWISQTLGDVFDGIGDLGKPLQDLSK